MSATYRWPHRNRPGGIDSINKAILDIDKTTQQNAALVEQAAASAESMSQQSDNLRNLVSFFKLDQANTEQRVERRRTDRPMVIRSQRVI